MLLFILFPGYNDNHTKWPKTLISKLLKIGEIYYPPDIIGKTKLNIKKFVDLVGKEVSNKISTEIADKKNIKIIVLCHSIGSWFAYYYAKKYKVDMVISLDGSRIGKYVIYAVKRVLAKDSGDILLKNLVLQGPLNATKWPVKTVCYRNIISNKNIKDKEHSDNVQSLLEAANIKNYTANFYVNLGHYLHENNFIQKEVIKLILKFDKNTK